MNKTYKILFNLILLFNFFGTYIDSLGNNRYSNHDTVFVMSNQGFTDYVVIDCDSLSNETIFWKSIDWINKTYKNPNETIKSQVIGEYIILEGIAPSLCKMKVLGSLFLEDVRYRIEISFKNGRYKLDVVSLESYSRGSQYTPPGWYDMKIDEIRKYYYKENGQIQPRFKSYEVDIPKYFNELNQNLKGYILNSDNSKQNDW